MKFENYTYDTFPSYDKDIEGIIELHGEQNNLRCRLYDVVYQDDCMIRFLFPNTILDEERHYPLIIHVQGSGWFPQDMNDHIFDFMPLVKKGYAFAIIQYHSAPDFRFPTQIIDTKKAIRFIEKHAQEYPIDLNHVYLSGDSSGGHTALMTLFTYDNHLFDEDETPLIPLSGALDFYGVVHFSTMGRWWSKYSFEEQNNISALLGEYTQEDLEYASPICHLQDNLKLPPLLILHGSKDHVVPFTQSEELYLQMKSYGYDVSLARVHDADHGRSIFYVDDTYECILQFLKKCEEK